MRGILNLSMMATISENASQRLHVRSENRILHPTSHEDGVLYERTNSLQGVSAFFRNFDVQHVLFNLDHPREAPDTAFIGVVGGPGTVGASLVFRQVVAQSIHQVCYV